MIIEDMNLKKEHIYKIKDKKKLKLVSEGRSEITITKNRVHILLEKGSRFKVSFSLEGEVSSNLDIEWLIVKNSICIRNSRAKWKNAKKICTAMGGRVPTIEELKKVIKDCGGMIDDNNQNNVYYQSCYKRKSFTK